MNDHPSYTGEHLAQRCLDEARGDYSVAGDLIKAQPASARRDHAMAALALWSNMMPIANDNEIG